MSRNNKWVPIDQYLGQDLKLIKGPFSRIEAMFAYTLDCDKGKCGTIAGYSVQWQWSRNKVRRFLDCIRTVEGHLKDSKRTAQGHPIHFIDLSLADKKDSRRTDQGQTMDSRHDTTIQPNTKTKTEKEKKKIKKKSFSDYLQEKIIENNFIETKDKIFEFYKYRQAKPKAKQYQSEKGIDGLFRNLNGCRDAGLIISECLDIAMERNWQSFDSSYYKQNNNKNGFANKSEQNTQTCKEWANGQ